MRPVHVRQQAYYHACKAGVSGALVMYMVMTYRVSY